MSSITKVSGYLYEGEFYGTSQAARIAEIKDKLSEMLGNHTVDFTRRGAGFTDDFVYELRDVLINLPPGRPY